MIRITVTAGADFDRHGDRITLPARMLALARIRGSLAQDFGGYSEFKGHGGWVDAETGESVDETCHRFIVLTDDNGKADPQEVARMVRDELRQKSVLLEVEYVAAEFVELDALDAMA